MTLQRVRELLEAQAFIDQGYNLDAAKLILVGLGRE